MMRLKQCEDLVYVIIESVSLSDNYARSEAPPPSLLLIWVPQCGVIVAALLLLRHGVKSFIDVAG